MSTAPHKHITLQQFMGRPEPEDDPREELIERRTDRVPGAKFWHAAIFDRLSEQLRPLNQKGYMLANDFSCILGTTSMPAPDLAAVSIERANQPSP